ncbi:hypothetical protein [Bacteroides stercorirosoris]|uniref:Uncharacterized protein n=1 Tax=Bacteroides stercorirosoris TaxID=871324 RepID=A0A413HB99_9BACE|nr:hypothetical protein [Bacteroides stercorirosoris]RGX80789.1 hypothetical protein DXA68_02305 [Bacteroides stercorirosoris]
MSESDGTKIGVSFEIPSLYFDSFLIAFVVSKKLQPIKRYASEDYFYSSKSFKLVPDAAALTK